MLFNVFHCYEMLFSVNSMLFIVIQCFLYESAIVFWRNVSRDPNGVQATPLGGIMTVHGLPQ